MKRYTLRRFNRIFIPLTAIALSTSAAPAQAPAPPENVSAQDHPWDDGTRVDVLWDLSPDDPNASEQQTEDTTGPTFMGYEIFRLKSESELQQDIKDERTRQINAAMDEAAERVLHESLGDQIDQDYFLINDIVDALALVDDEQLDDVRRRIREARLEAAQQADATFEREADEWAAENKWAFEILAQPGVTEYTIESLDTAASYRFRVRSKRSDGTTSDFVETPSAVSPAGQWFIGDRVYLLLITLIFCGAVVAFIFIARSGRPLNVRKIGGLEAVDEAVGRATEMGRSVLFVPGIQDMNEVQTIAGITILSRVAKTAAEYDAKVEVPTARSLVMTSARETVQAAFLAAGRPDAYNEDLIYYVTDEQFGYVAYLSGMMVREKPAACFYMGMFYAESLILAETGNSIGAIQVAGTAQPAQLPFFVAACDYTLIGEEFFAASAYLSGSAEELGSLKGQDVGKVIVAIFLILGVLLASLGTLAAVNGWAMAETLNGIVEYIKEVILT